MRIQDIDYLAIAPPLLIAVVALAALFAEAFRPAWRRVAGSVAFGGIVLTLAVHVVLASNVITAGAPRRTFCLPDGGCSYVVDDFTLLLQAIMLAATGVVLLIAQPEIRETRLPTGEFHFLLLAALSGALVLAAGRDLITLVVSLEVVSLPLFALVALRRYDSGSAEAGLKMFLVSVVSAAVMLFGVSLVYGVTGSMHLDRIAQALAAPAAGLPVTAVGVVLVLVGFGFKVSAVPFHFWAPDTYQGAPIAVAAFLSVVSKAAGVAGLVLVLVVGFAPYAHVWGPLLAVLAAATMTAGNLVALRQRAAVRLLAWSSIAQAGYILAPLGAAAGLGLAAPELVSATIGYLAIYAVMNIGAFAVVGFMGRANARLDDYRGLAAGHPLVALAMAFFLSCLAGLPPGLAGLFAKIVVFRATVAAGYGWLAVLMAVNTVIGLYYYLSWASRMFTGAADRRPVGLIPLPVAAAIAITAAGTVLLSVLPQLVLGIAPG